MPLDTSSESRAEIARKLGARAAYAFSDKGLCPSAHSDDEARASFALWDCLSALPEANLVFIRGSKRVSAVSRQGGMVLEADKPVNLGLLRALLKAETPVDYSALQAPDPVHFNKREQTIWALAKRLGRVEAPRCFELLLGDAEYVLNADATGFDIIEQSGGVARIRTKIDEALALKATIEYTLGSLQNTNATSRHTVDELFGAETGDHAVFAASGWPLVLPKTIAFDDLSCLMAAVQTFATQDAQIVELRNTAGAQILRMENKPDCQNIEVQVKK